MPVNLALPTLLGPYRLIDKLTVSGDSVYLAEDSRLSRQVAVRVQHASADAAARFLRDGRILTSIEHPNLCPVFDVGQAGDMCYLVTPIVEGQPLARRINPERPWPAAQAVAVVRQMALALQIMHERGIAHGAVGAATVLIRPGGDALLTFGPIQTQTADPATDVKALGALLYQLLTGTAVTDEPPRPLSACRPDLPPSLDSVCLRALSRNPREQFGSISEFAAALITTAPTAKNPARSTDPRKAARAERVLLTDRRSRSRMTAWIGIGMLLLAGAGVGIWYAVDPPRNEGGDQKKHEESAALVIEPVEDATLTPGGSVNVTARVVRPSSKGRVELRWDGLPATVRPEAAVLEDGSDQASIRINARADAEPGTHSVRLVAIGPSSRSEQVVRIHVQPKVAAFQLEKMNDIALTPGQTQNIPVRITRANSQARVDLQLEGLPAGVQLDPAFILANGNEANLVLRAQPNAAVGSHPIRLVARSADGRTEQMVQLRVQAAKPAGGIQLEKVADVQLPVGQSCLVPISIARKGHDGAVEVQVDDLPAGVQSARATIPAGANSGNVQLTAEAGIAGGAHSLRLIAIAGDIREETVVRLVVQPPPRPIGVLRLSVKDEITVTAGVGTTITVGIERENCPGPVELTFEDLPLGITAAKVIVPAEAPKLTLVTATQAATRAANVRIVGVAGNIRGEVPTRLVVKRIPIGPNITNSIGLRLVPIAPGRFTMGDNAVNDAPQHEVEITKLYHIASSEVTQEQYQKVMKSNPSWFQVTGGGKAEVSVTDPKTLPVENVTWQEAQDFCKRLSELPAEKNAGRTYRLPTEAEWEYACRGGHRFQGAAPFYLRQPVNDVTQRSFDKTPGPRLVNCQGLFYLDDDGNRMNDEFLRTDTVSTRDPNVLGLYDMHGNVAEWCQDYYGPYDGLPARDPLRANKDSFDTRVVRGGSWKHDPNECRAGSRLSAAPGQRSHAIGFRVVCEVAPKAP